MTKKLLTLLSLMLISSIATAQTIQLHTICTSNSGEDQVSCRKYSESIAREMTAKTGVRIRVRSSRVSLDVCNPVTGEMFYDFNTAVNCWERRRFQVSRDKLDPVLVISKPFSVLPERIAGMANHIGLGVWWVAPTAIAEHFVYDYQYSRIVALHELAHLLGIYHDDRSYNIMHPYAPGICTYLSMCDLAFTPAHSRAIVRWYAAAQREINKGVIFCLKDGWAKTRAGCIREVRYMHKADYDLRAENHQRVTRRDTGFHEGSRCDASSVRN